MTTASRLLLLDTNIVILLSRAGAIGQAIDARFQLRARGDRPLLSAITLGEALAFAQFRNWGPPRLATLRDVLREFVTVDITSGAVLGRYADIDTYLTRNGRAVADNDVWIAACASAADATLLTTDRDFDPLHGEYLNRIWIDPHNPGATSQGPDVSAGTAEKRRPHPTHDDREAPLGRRRRWRSQRMNHATG